MPQNRHFDLNLLRVFDAVYRTGSFTMAAEELDLTQSSVSNAINRLKSELGVSLFVRAGRGIQPTLSAEQLFSQIDRPLIDIEQAIQGFNSFDPSTHQYQFNVYALEVMIQLLIGSVYKQIDESKTEVTFRQSPASQEQAVQALYYDQADLLLDICPPDSSMVEAEKLISFGLKVVVRKGHPRIKESITKEQFYQEKHVFINIERQQTSAFDTVAVEGRGKRQLFCEQTSMLSMLSTVSSSNAIASSLDHFADEFAPLFNLNTLAMPIEVNPFDIYMIWHKKHTHNPAHQWLRSLIRESLPATSHSQDK
ncbi:LysR family transcriptional regulator [Aliagarivorans marinus]|uniref:LysR family transcriptional regulator n=1 Tax=Aliagarivorans marinus TaxID=561965 RepID=UPI00047D0F27|nr:LysR family transcriptional regulator [Aliagarivorans marinus]